eukprot:TRINITY_DN38662_c0_g1_i1.p1 TRINITY_DN38662_c0_g1~~TRINITY_DN38662_c0_g1_i1.p1  ORF type:complete len:482 (-),score=44.44 TRINITY_DN38662_c0_g1_i1:99-1544(-)
MSFVNSARLTPPSLTDTLLGDKSRPSIRPQCFLAAVSLYIIVGIATVVTIGAIVTRTMDDSAKGPLQPVVLIGGTSVRMGIDVSTAQRTASINLFTQEFRLRHNQTPDALEAVAGDCIGITLYEDEDYRGASLTLGLGWHGWLGFYGWNKVASSMQVPKGCWVWLCKYRDCELSGRGGSSEFIQDVPRLGQFKNWASALHVFSYNADDAPRAMLFKDCSTTATYGWFAGPGEYRKEDLEHNHIGDNALSATMVMSRAVLSTWKEDRFSGIRGDIFGPQPWSDANTPASCYRGWDNFHNDEASSLKVFDLSRANGGGFSAPVMRWQERASGSAGQHITAKWSLGFNSKDPVSRISSSTFSAEISDALRVAGEYDSLTGPKKRLGMSARASLRGNMAFSLSVSQEQGLLCDAACMPHTCAYGEVFLWSWTATVRRRSADYPGAASTSISTCDFVCTCSSSPPACPLGLCRDTHCNACSEAVDL